ncbi:hypothetical protein [Bacillus sp. PS06]|nr:hypothetical protein [Bacillus sp. PS06]
MTDKKKKAQITHMQEAIKNNELKRDFVLYSEIETEKMMDDEKK